MENVAWGRGQASREHLAFCPPLNVACARLFVLPCSREVPNSYSLVLGPSHTLGKIRNEDPAYKLCNLHHRSVTLQSWEFYFAGPPTTPGPGEANTESDLTGLALTSFHTPPSSLILSVKVRLSHEESAGNHWSSWNKVYRTEERSPPRQI